MPLSESLPIRGKDVAFADSAASRKGASHHICGLPMCGAWLVWEVRVACMLGATRGGRHDAGEIQTRYRRDKGEMQVRYRRDTAWVLLGEVVAANPPVSARLAWCEDEGVRARACA